MIVLYGARKPGFQSIDLSEERVGKSTKSVGMLETHEAPDR